MEIKSYAFWGCNSLKEIWCANPTPPVCPTQDGPFTSTNFSNCTVYVPRNSKDAYKSDEYWSSFQNFEEATFSDIYSENLGYTIYGDGAIVSYANSSEKNPVIPDEITINENGDTEKIININAISGCFSSDYSDGKVSKVVGIASDVFKNSDLVSITVESSIPPVCENDCFNQETYQNCELVVPEEAKERYASADVWKNFKCISSHLDDIAVDMSEIVVVYSLTGVKVYEGRLDSVHLTSGIYIVKTTDKSFKIMIS